TSPIGPKRPDGGSSGGIINIINDTRNIIDNSVDSTVVNNNGSKVSNIFNTFNEIVNNDGNSPMEIINNITSLFSKSDTSDNTSGIIDNPINISPVSTIMENLPMNENQSSDVELSNSQVEMDTQSTVNLNMDTPEQTESYVDFSEIEGFSIDDNGSRVRVANESFESRNISDDLGSALKGVQTGELADKGLDQLSNFSGVNKSGLSAFFGSYTLFRNYKS